MKIGIIIGGALLLGVGGFLLFKEQVTSNPDTFRRVDTVELKGKATREFVSLCENPKIREILRVRHKIVPTCNQTTSAATVAEKAGEGQDFLVPASDTMAATYKGRIMQIQPVFSSPLIGFTRTSHAQSLRDKSLVLEAPDGSLVLPFAKLTQLLSIRATWQSVGVNEYGPIKVRGTNLESTTSGQALLHLLTAMFNNDEPVTIDSMDALVSKVKPIVDRLGQLPSTTNDLLNICLSTGCTDLNFGLESTYLRIVNDFAVGDENAKKSAEGMKKNLTVLYPQPAAWGHHTMIALTEGGRRFLSALADNEIQTIAWTQHGLRTPGQGIRMDSSSATVPGVASVIGAAVTQPTAEINTLFTRAVLGKQ
jgi:hypothetical protein